LGTQLVGARQAERFTGLMDSYAKAQQVAADAQNHLNAAEQADLAIKEQLINRLVGLKSAWAEAMSEMNRKTGATSFLADFALYYTNLLKLLAHPELRTPKTMAVVWATANAYSWTGLNRYMDKEEAQRKAMGGNIRDGAPASGGTSDVNLDGGKKPEVVEPGGTRDVAIHTQEEYAKLIPSEIGSLFRDLGGVTRSAELANELAGMRTQLEFLKTTEDALNKSDAGSPQLKQIQDARVQLEAELGAKSSDGYRGLVAAGDRANLAREEARATADAGTYGDGVVQQLNNREATLRRHLALEMQKIDLGKTELERENAMNRALEYSNELEQVAIDRMTKKGDIQKEEWERSRKLIGATPQDLMRRIVAERIVAKGHGKMGSAEFMSYAPSMREAIVEAKRSADNRAALKNAPTADSLSQKFGLASQHGDLSRGVAAMLANETTNAAKAARAMASAHIDASTSAKQLAAEFARLGDAVRAALPSAPSAGGPPRLPQATGYNPARIRGPL